MIGKVSRGGDTSGLLRYLFGPGRANEHVDPHVVAAWDDAIAAAPVTGTRAEQRELARLLDQPLAALARRPTKTLWHCSIRAAPGDRLLSDEEWAETAREVLHTVGLARRDDVDVCRWVAVRHADDHIHLAVTLARQDGRLPRASHDFARVGQACQALEARFGLTTTAARDGSAPRRPSRGEQEKARRTGMSRPPREVLRREVRVAAASANDVPSYFQRLREQGVMVKERRSTTNPGEVTGYAVAWPGDRNAAGAPVWFGGGQLAPDLSLPRLRAAWIADGSPTTPQLRSSPRTRKTRQRLSGASSALRSASVAIDHAERGDHLAATATTAAAVARLVASRRGR